MRKQMDKGKEGCPSPTLGRRCGETLAQYCLAYMFEARVSTSRYTLQMVNSTLSE